MRRTLALGILLAAIAPAAQAQDKGQLGINASIGEGSRDVGVTYHVSGRFALRPSFRYTTTEDETAFVLDSRCGEGGPREPGCLIPIPQAEIETTEWGLGLSVLYYMGRKDSLSTYLAASGHYGKATAEVGRVPGGGARGEQTTDGWTWGGTLGAQYSVAKRFGLFAEVGVRYANRESRFNESSVFTTVGASMGAVFYLR